MGDCDAAVIIVGGRWQEFKVYGDRTVCWMKMIPVSNNQRRERMVPSIDGNVVVEMFQEDSRFKMKKFQGSQRGLYR